VRSVFEGFYDIHFTTSKEEREATLRAVLQGWEVEAASSTHMKKFIEYAKSWWLPVDDSRFPDWQIYFTNPGMATTNNAVEQFNAHIKSVRIVDW
jgi:hypothetical protein